LLNKYAADSDGYTDCYSVDIDFVVTHAEFVAAFYTTWLFKLERIILKTIVAKPSTDEQARQLADGVIDTFAAWQVEGRSERELILCDFRGRTRSWLMSLTTENGAQARTRLYFGSAVLPEKNEKIGSQTLGLSVYLMLGFHKLYSRALLYSAKLRLIALAA
jgi:hypothetical protein